VYRNATPALVALLALTSAVTPADGQTDPSQTPAAPQVAATTAETGAQPTEKKPSDGIPLEGVFKNGFTLRTADGKNELRLAASFQLDSRFYFGDSVAPDSFDIRRARLDFNAKMYDFMSVRIQAALEDNPYVRNAYLDLGRGNTWNLRIGQMKVPFSTKWLTLDNQVNFIERASAEPVYPFFDRGLMLWGNVADKALNYQLGVYNGNGVDAEGNKGDIDDHKDAAARLFYQPFRHRKGSAVEGLYVVGEGTYALTSSATRRFETRGLLAANFESMLWRWRADQVIGTDGRNTDLTSTEIDSRTRIGAELHYLNGPLTLSAEWLKTDYDGIAVYHDYMVGSSRVAREPVLTRDGSIRSLSVWGSWFLTGERKIVDAFGWRQPTPLKPYTGKGTGGGAWEVLARFSQTETDPQLFDTLRVNGYAAGELPPSILSPVGEGNSVTASVLQGSGSVREMTLGVNWTMNYYFRIIFDFTTIKALDFEDGRSGIVSGGNSELSDPTAKNRLVELEHMVAVRFVVRI
jgi:phosphate-selective porin OprO/OprP